MKTILVFFLLVPVIVSAQSFQWNNINSAPIDPNRHEDIMFINSNTGWVVNLNGKIYKTTNGGAKFDTVNLSGGLRSVGFLDANTGIVGTLTESTPLFRTTNGGTNWTLLTNIPFSGSYGICGITQLPPNIFYAVGRYSGPAIAIKSTDKGATWINLPIDTSQARRLVDTYFFDPLHGFIVGSKGGTTFENGYAVVLYTSDGGVSWQNKYNGSQLGYLCWKIDFRGTQFGYISCENFFNPPAYLITTNGGMNWTLKTVPEATGLDVEGIGFLNSETGWIGGHQTTYQTTNSGANWFSVPFATNLNRVQFLSDTLAYACGKTIYKYSGTTEVHQISTEIPDEFRLSQNFPNPFNPSTKIRFSVHERSDVSLKIYNVSGKELVTLTDMSYQPGEYETTFTGNEYPSGVYYAKLVSGNHTETIKMVLIK